MTTTKLHTGIAGLDIRADHETGELQLQLNTPRSPGYVLLSGDDVSDLISVLAVWLAHRGNR